MRTLNNKVQLIGNLGMDPSMKELNNGQTVTKFSLATSDTYKDKDGKKVTETQWHNLIVWGKAAQVAGNYLQKGSRIAVEGKLVNRSYEDKEGNKRYITEIVVNDFMMLNSSKSE